MKIIPTFSPIAHHLLTLVLCSVAVLTLVSCGPENAELKERLTSLEQKVEALSEQNHRLQIEVFALATLQKRNDDSRPGLLQPQPSTYEEALAQLQQKEVRNRVLFKLKPEDFVAGFLELAGPTYQGQLSGLRNKLMELEVALKGVEMSGKGAEHPEVMQLKTALDLVNERLLEEITSQKKAMEVDVEILREQVKVMEPEKK